MMPFYCRQLLIEDVPRLLELFERVPPSIARLSSRLAYKAIIDDALRTRNVAIFVASLDNNLVGYTIAAWDWNYFKRMFVLRHPLVGLLALADRLKKKPETHDTSAHNLRRRDVVTLQTARDKSQTHAWEDNAKTIAKIIYTGIDPQVRSGGLGRGLYAHLIMHFKQQGFTRIEAHIDKGNLASINMHKKAGWSVIQNRTGFFAFYEIKREGVDGNK